MHSSAYNLNLLNIMVEELEDFLLSQEVFWPLGGNPIKDQPPYPQLSLGQLQLTLKELEAVEDQLDSEESLQWVKLRDRAWALRTKWTTAMAHKALAEASQRVNLWRAYLQDVNDDGITPANYSYEVRHRVILTLLSELTQILDDSQIQKEIDALDVMLQGMISGPEAFIWDERLSAVYPKHDFWFLYWSPQKQDNN